VRWVRKWVKRKLTPVTSAELLRHHHTQLDKLAKRLRQKFPNAHFTMDEARDGGRILLRIDVTLMAHGVLWW